MYSTLYQL